MLQLQIQGKFRYKYILLVIKPIEYFSLLMNILASIRSNRQGIQLVTQCLHLVCLGNPTFKVFLNIFIKQKTTLSCAYAKLIYFLVRNSSICVDNSQEMFCDIVHLKSSIEQFML